ncbi:MAG: TIGR02466 family protein [Alphaproteobacteria bacterium]
MAKERRIPDSDLLRMFPTFVWRARLGPDAYAPINDSIVRKLAMMGAPLAELTPGESWQSDHGLHRLEEFRDLASAIDETAGSVLDHLKIGHEGVRITGCWANVNAPGAGHRAHSHPNNFLSGVYYVRTRPGADTINFHDPRPQTGIIRPPVRELGAETADQVAVTVEDGTLLVFPAWLEHSVDPNRSDSARISIGFNLMFAEYAEVMGRPSWQAGRRHPSRS